MQIIADVCGLPTRRNQITDAASLGSAMCVAVALGDVEDFEQAMQSMVQADITFTPNAANTEFYQEFNTRVFKRLSCHTDPLLRELYLLTN